jgi:uncharacterized protein
VLLFAAGAAYLHAIAPEAQPPPVAVANVPIDLPRATETASPALGQAQAPPPTPAAQPQLAATQPAPLPPAPEPKPAAATAPAAAATPPVVQPAPPDPAPAALPTVQSMLPRSPPAATAPPVMQAMPPPSPPPVAGAAPAPAAPPAAAAPGQSKEGQAGAVQPQSRVAPPPAQVANLPPATPRAGVAPARGALAAAPDPGLIEDGPDGPLPKIGTDGREPWRVYARPFDRADKRPRIAVVVTWLGLSSRETQAAISRLPGGVTLAFSPYTEQLDLILPAARASGHEVLLALPMEPLNFPDNDPGPNALLTGLSQEENLARLNWVLSRAQGYAGVMTHMGGRFTAIEPAIKPVIEALKARGLLLVDNRLTLRGLLPRLAADLQLPYLAGARFLDGEASRVQIEERLQDIEQTARQNGTALLLATISPVAIERLASWASELEGRGMALAPASALVRVGE